MALSSMPADQSQKLLDSIRMRAPASASNAYAPPPPPPPPPGGHAQQWNQQAPPPPPPPPPPRSEHLAATGVFATPPNGGSEIVERMKKLTKLRDMGAITNEDFERRKAEMLNEI
jgi:hypothetical protein